LNAWQRTGRDLKLKRGWAPASKPSERKIERGTKGIRPEPTGFREGCVAEYKKKTWGCAYGGRLRSTGTGNGEGPKRKRKNGRTVVLTTSQKIILRFLGRRKKGERRNPLYQAKRGSPVSLERNMTKEAKGVTSWYAQKKFILSVTIRWHYEPRVSREVSKLAFSQGQKSTHLYSSRLTEREFGLKVTGHREGNDGGVRPTFRCKAEEREYSSVYKAQENNKPTTNRKRPYWKKAGGGHETGYSGTTGEGVSRK